MTKIKLTNGAIINALEVKIENGFLKIVTEENTVEELAQLFSNKQNTNCITLMTETGIESGIKVGFTSFVGIDYNAEGVKTVCMMQPVDITEARLSNAEGSINAVGKEVSELETTVNALLGEEGVINE